MRLFYEKFNVYIYLIAPLLLILLHYILVNFAHTNILDTKNFSERVFEFVLTMFGVLLTIFGFIFTLPDNEYRKLMKKYKHDKIIYNTIFCCILSSLLFMTFYFMEIATFMQEILFIIIFSEVTIATWWIFRTLKAINR